MKNTIFSGFWGKCHCQGIAVDQRNGYLYYSFTTKLVKSDLDGNIIGSVDNIIGHLGCIDFNELDGKIYGSLEYKNDSIGKGILNNLGLSGQKISDGFYVAIFDVDKIDRMDMDAEKDGIVKTVYLKTVVDDYEGVTVNQGVERKHVYGCSGIDGLTIGPDFGCGKGSERFLCVCYGIYSDLDRTDNDYQVILQYDVKDWWESVASPILQGNMSKVGPLKPRNRYFLYTGNTTYGVQNLEYDEYTGNYFACVYKGKKQEFPNYSMFVIDGSKPAKIEELKGRDFKEQGLVLSLKNTGLEQNGIFGLDFPFGSTGFYSFGDGRYYVSENFTSENKEQATNVCMYDLNINDERWQFTKRNKS